MILLPWRGPVADRRHRINFAEPRRHDRIVRRPAVAAQRRRGRHLPIDLNAVWVHERSLYDVLAGCRQLSSAQNTAGIIGASTNSFLDVTPCEQTPASSIYVSLLL